MMKKIIIATTARGGGKTFCADMLKKVTEEAEKEISELKAEIERLKNENKKLKEGNAYLSDEYDRLKDIEEAWVSLQFNITADAKRLLKLEVKVDKLEKDKATLEKENKKLRIELQGLAQSKLDEAVVELVEAEAKIAKLEKEKAYFEDLYEKRLKLYNEVVKDYNKLKNKQSQEDCCRADVETSKVIKYDKLMQDKLDAVNAKIAKFERKIERKDKYIEKIRHENDLLESKCRLRESDLKCLEKMYFELGDKLEKTKKEYDKVVKQRDELVNIFKDALKIGGKHD